MIVIKSLLINSNIILCSSILFIYFYKMIDTEHTIELLNKLIADREEHFQHALSDCAEQSLIAHLKNDIEFLKEKRKKLREEIVQEEHKFFS